MLVQNLKALDPKIECRTQHLITPTLPSSTPEETHFPLQH